MAQIDSSIALGVQPLKLDNPLNQLAQILQVQHLQQQGQLGEMTMEERRRAIGETNKLNELFSGAVGADGKIDRNRIYQGAASQGLGSRIPGLQRQFAEADKGTAEVDKTLGEVTTKKAALFRDALSNVTDPQSAAQWLSAQYQDPHLSKLFQIPAAQAIANIPKDPAGFQQWVQKQALGMTQYVEKNAPKVTQMDKGGAIDLVATPGLGGAPSVLSTTQKTQSPDSVARLAQDRENAAQGVTYQQLEDGSFAALPTKLAPGVTPVARTAMGPDGKPVVGGGKPLTDAQAKAALFGTRMQEANKIFDALEKTGTTTSIPGSRAGMGVGPIINALSPADQQQLDQAKRDFINAVLRRESGAVIAESEFKNAEQQYFPQIGDTPQVIAQKKQNREIAQRGIMAEVPQGKRASLTAEITGQPQSGAFSDPEKESRYQAWKRQQSGQK